MRKFSRILLVLTLVFSMTPQLQAACAPDACVGPCTYEEILYETKFTTNCIYWNWSGGASRVQLGTKWKAQFSSTGTLYQVQGTDVYSSMEMAFDFERVAGGTPGTERLVVDLMIGANVVETVDMFSPSDTSGYYTYNTGNYSLTAITTRFRYVPGVAPGNTVFRVDNVTLWGIY
jgi:hypothetical protein